MRVIKGFCFVFLSLFMNSICHGYNTSNDTFFGKIQSSQTIENYWALLKGSVPDNAIYLGMFTWHFNTESRMYDRCSNNLIGILYDGVFIGTLLNSFSDRAFVFGLQRNIYTANLRNSQANLGYRLGVMSGYDHRMSNIANYVPVFPVPEVYINYIYKNFGLEFSYVGVVFTVKFFLNFGRNNKW